MQFIADHDFSAEIDIFNMVLKLRENRPHMVQTEVSSRSGLKFRVHNRKITFLFLNQNIYCGFSKDPSQSSFEYPKHV